MNFESIIMLIAIVALAATMSIGVYFRKSDTKTLLISTIVIFAVGVSTIPMTPLYAMVYCAVWGTCILAPWHVPQRKAKQVV